MSLLELLGSQLGGGTVDRISQQVGADPAATGKAMSAAIPVLLGALARNVQQPQGASALSNALERDHDGSILNNLDGFLGQGDTSPGEGILGHVLGGRRDTVAAGISKSSGLDLAAVQRLLPLLAPIVLGMLGKQKRSTGMGADGLAAMLGRESRAAERQTGGIVEALLDQDGDGDLTDDVLRIGSSLLGGMFKR